MPTLLAPPPVAKHDAEVTAQLQDAAGRIRFRDVTLGLLLFAVVVMSYTAIVASLDKWLELPAWLRQIGAIALYAGLGLIVWRRIVRPLRYAINPLYAAKLVEATVPDAKNGIVNWVDLHDHEMPASVRAAVAAKAAKQMKAADFGRAVETPATVRLGSAVAALVVLFGVLFLVFKPAVFASLVGRALNPFTGRAIATRTHLTLLDPVSGDATITAGTPLVIKVQIDGREPDGDAPDRVRLLLRHNPADPNFEEVPFEPAGGRAWQVRVPEYLVQNGFWYRVAAGDAETPEYRLAVRPRPIFTAFKVAYEYPAYLRMKPETAREPRIEAYRGTKITVTATANRELKDGRMVVAGQQTLAGDVVGPNRDSLRLAFTLMESGSYRLFFNSTGGEANSDSPPYELRTLTDQAPTIVIASPVDDEILLPVNGLLKVDATINDDFGIDAAALKLKIVDGSPLTGKPYQGGKSFRRETDGTYPATVEYKDSLALGELKEAAGKPLTLKEGQILEYWLEATDNCTVPAANVGRSKVLRIRLSAPEVPAKQEQTARDDTKRQRDEKQHQDKQAEKFQKEDRPAKPSPQEKKNDPNADPAKKEPGDAAKNGEGAPGQGAKGAAKPEDAKNQGDKSDPSQPGEKGAEPSPKDAMKPGESETAKDAQPKPGEKPEGPKKSDGAPNAGPPMPDPKPGDTPPAAGGKPNEEQPKPSGDKTGNPMKADGSPMPDPNATAEPKGGSPNEPPAQKDVKQQAEKVQRELDRMKQEAGEARGETPEKPAGNGTSSEKKQPSKNDKTEPMPPAKGTPEAGEPPPMPMPGGSDAKPGDAGAKPDAKPGQSKGAGSSNPEDDTDLQRNLSELGSDDPKKLQEARDRLDKELGKDARENAERLLRERDSNDETTSKAAKKKLEELQKQVDELAKKKKPEKAEPKDTDEPKESTEKKGDAASSAKDAGAPKPKPGEDPLGKPGTEPKPGDKAEGTPKPGEDPMGKPGTEPKAGEKTEGAPKPKPGEDPMGKPGTEPKPGDKVEGTPKPKPGEDPMGKPGTEPKAGEKTEGAPKPKPGEDPMGKPGTEPKPGDKAEGTPKPKPGEDKKSELDGKGMERPAPDAALEKKPNPSGGRGEKKPDAKDMENALKDLGSDDASKKKAAQEKLDKAVGKPAREEAEKTLEDLKSKDDATRKAAEKKIDDLKKQAGERAKGDPSSEPMLTPAEAADLAKAAKDLNSPDEATRQNAEKKLDDAIGKENRESLQKQKHDGDKPGESLSESQKNALEEMAKRAKGRNGETAPRPGGPAGVTPDSETKPLEANPENAKKAAQLQLEQFKKEKGNKELLKRLGWTDADYERFLKGAEAMEKNAPAPAPSGTAAPPASAPVDQRRTDSAGKVETRGDGSKTSPQAAGPTAAAPGYSEAQKKFAEAAAKAKRDEAKK